ncbi:MAG TPA: OmpA family protein [Vicinamibacterales bacterium]|nr:OmpA family protein [Vicinamibacterales bacterium]
MSQLRRTIHVLAVGVIVVGTTTACATKKFVRTEVNAVGTRVETLSQSLETTQEATRQNQARITQVDAKADQVGIWAKDAQTSAATAQNAATAAAARVDAVEASTKRLVYEVVISEDQGEFKFGSAALPDGVRARIDEMIAQLKAEPKGNFVEIEGHTDSSGDKMVNARIGEARAEAVKRYLYDTHQVPLHKMNVISYGEEKPASPNNTRQGRAQNRRVVIRILA